LKGLERRFYPAIGESWRQSGRGGKSKPHVNPGSGAQIFCAATGLKAKASSHGFASPDQQGSGEA
jgi:hypothetical protein